MKNTSSLFILILILACFSCNKEISELPPATQSGANTFGCKIDGKLWGPSGFGIIPTAAPLEARYMADHNLIINARNFSSSPTETEIELFIKNASEPGTYSLNTTVSYPTFAASYGYYVHRKFSPDNEWMSSDQYTGSIMLTKIDTVNLIVSGTFEFHAINLYNSPQPINVTEGRFDIKYK